MSVDASTKPAAGGFTRADEYRLQELQRLLRGDGGGAGGPKVHRRTVSGQVPGAATGPPPGGSDDAALRAELRQLERRQASFLQESLERMRAMAADPRNAGRGGSAAGQRDGVGRWTAALPGWLGGAATTDSAAVAATSDAHVASPSPSSTAASVPAAITAQPKSSRPATPAAAGGTASATVAQSAGFAVVPPQPPAPEQPQPRGSVFGFGTLVRRVVGGISSTAASPAEQLATPTAPGASRFGPSTMSPAAIPATPPPEMMLPPYELRAVDTGLPAHAGAPGHVSPRQAPMLASQDAAPPTATTSPGSTVVPTPTARVGPAVVAAPPDDAKDKPALTGPGLLASWLPVAPSASAESAAGRSRWSGALLALGLLLTLAATDGQFSGGGNGGAMLRASLGLQAAPLAGDGSTEAGAHASRSPVDVQDDLADPDRLAVDQHAHHHGPAPDEAQRVGDRTPANQHGVTPFGVAFLAVGTGALYVSAVYWLLIPGADGGAAPGGCDRVVALWSPVLRLLALRAVTAAAAATGALRVVSWVAAVAVLRLSEAAHSNAVADVAMSGAARRVVPTKPQRHGQGLVWAEATVVAVSPVAVAAVLLALGVAFTGGRLRHVLLSHRGSASAPVV